MPHCVTGSPCTQSYEKTLLDVVRQRGIFHTRLHIRARVFSVLRFIRAVTRLAMLPHLGGGKNATLHAPANVLNAVIGNLGGLSTLL